MPQKDLTPLSNLLQHAAQVNPVSPPQLSCGNLPAYEILTADGAIQHYLALRCLRPISRWSWAIASHPNEFLKQRLCGVPACGSYSLIQQEKQTSKQTKQSEEAF